MWLIAARSLSRRRRGGRTAYSRDLYFAGGLRAPGRQPDLHGGIDGDDDELHRPARPRAAASCDPQLRAAARRAQQRGPARLGPARLVARGDVLLALHGTPDDYAWEAYGSAGAALQRAARQIAITGKPVGLLVQHGTHAMVMTGFSASARPGAAAAFTLVLDRISDPYGSAHRCVPGRRTTPLNTYLETDATTAGTTRPGTASYIVIVPQG